jgi:hypothetical protein
LGVFGPVYDPKRQQKGYTTAPANENLNTEALARLRTTMRNMVICQQINQAVDITDFVSLACEEVVEGEADIIKAIAQQVDPGRDAETDEECEVISKISTCRAQAALHILQTYKEPQEEGEKM